MSLLRSFEGKVLDEMRNKLPIPDGEIPFFEDDLLSMSKDMQRGFIVEIKGSDIREIEQQLSDLLQTITSMPRCSLTFESMGYVLRSNASLLWPEYQEIHTKMKAVSDSNNIWFNFGIEQKTALPKRIMLSVFYFTGEIGLTSSDTSVEVDDEFRAQVRAIEKSMQ